MNTREEVSVGLRAAAETSYTAANVALEIGEAAARLQEAVRHQLTVADRRVRSNHVTGAARFFDRACALAFHRAVHFDSVRSPLAEYARNYVAPFRDSAVGRALRAPRTGRRTVSDPRRATRVCLLTRGNDNFLKEISALLEEDTGVDYRQSDLLEVPGLSKGLFSTKYMTEQILTNGASPKGQESIISRAERALRPAFESSDVAFVDWCGAAAVLVNLVDPRETRVVVRLHSYEAFTHWPHLIDWSRVDDLVFVSEHLRDFAVDAIPGLSEEHAPRLHVLPLNRDLGPFVRPKRSAEARFGLGLVSWGNVAKDPLWALEVLRELRRHDERYRLRLIGSEFDGEVSPAAARYGRQLEGELRGLEQLGAVVRAGQTTDVPAALTDVGVILSSSVRESFHAAVVEGTASGAVPVVRDWPFFAHRPTGARSLYPDEWVVSTPEQAAARILDLTQDESTWRAAGAQAQELTMSTWDWAVVKEQYARFFQGLDGLDQPEGSPDFWDG